MSSCNYRFRCSAVPQVTHYPQPIHYPEPTVPPPNHEISKDSKCNFKRSQLFCTSNNDDLVITTSTLLGLQFRSTVATLEVCQEDCSSVLHDICGVLHAIIPPEAVPFSFRVRIDILFRIMDEFGREVCQHPVSYAMDVLPNDSDSQNLPVILNLPFCIKCCDRPHSCDSKMNYRLQVDALPAPNNNLVGVVIRDVTWSAIVWENC
jgi:hypothetical protein